MTLKNEVDQLFLTEVESGNINYLSAPVAAVTPASGAPGAYQILLADAGAPVWWFCALILGNLAVGATRYDFGIARGQAGGGTDIAVIAIVMAAALAVFEQTIPVPYPVRVAALTGAAVQQRTASGFTLDVAMTYALAVGS